MQDSAISNVLLSLNPFWSQKDWPDVPSFQRYPFYQIQKDLENWGSQRAIFLRGFRGVGKTTLLKQIAIWLRDGKKVNPHNIIYINFEATPLEGIPWQHWFEIWQKEFKPAEGPVYFLFDEVQKSGGNWVHEVRSLKINPQYRIVVTGSAAAEMQSALDPEIRRWISVHIPPWLFYEYVQFCHGKENSFLSLENDILKGRPFFEKEHFDTAILTRVFDLIKKPFDTYLLKGGYPELFFPTVADGQAKLWQLINQALEKDMERMFKRDDLNNLRQLLEYICAMRGALLDKSKIVDVMSKERDNIHRAKIRKYIKTLRHADFIIELANQNDKDGKKLLKSAKPKVYPMASSLCNAMLLRKEDIFNRPDEVGHLVEGTVAAHLSAFADFENGDIGFWRKDDILEIDFVYQRPNGKYWILESKYGKPDLKWLKVLEKLQKRIRDNIHGCFLLSKDVFSVEKPDLSQEVYSKFKTMPAALFVYFLSREIWFKSAALDQSEAKTGKETVSHVDFGEKSVAVTGSSIKIENITKTTSRESGHAS